METSPSLDEMIHRVVAGDLDAFAEIIRVCQRPVRAWIVSRCPPGGDADDVAQQTFVAAFKRIDEYEVGTDFRAWLFTIARYQLMAECTRLKRTADYHSRYVPHALSQELDRRTGGVAEEPTRLIHLRECLAAPWLELKEMLPPDPESHGFDNVATAQEISYVQLARYLEAAEVAIDGAMRLRPTPKPTKVRTWFTEEGRFLGRDWKERYGSIDNRPEWTWFWQQPNNAQAPRRIRNTSQGVPGWYRFRVRCRATLWDHGKLLPPQEGQVAWVNTAANCSAICRCVRGPRRAVCFRHNH